MRDDARVNRFGAGFAADADVGLAAEQAATDALSALGGATPDLAFVFTCAASPDEVEQAGTRAVKTLGAVSVLGCSAGGVIGAGHAAEHASSVSVWAASLPAARLRTFHLEVLRHDDGMSVVGMPTPDGDDRVLVLLADPYSFPAEAFVDQLGALAAVGGMASGGGGPGHSRLLLDGASYDRGAVGVLVGGGVTAYPVVAQGCRPIGPEMSVTRVDGNVVLELAGQPALSKVEQVVRALDADNQALASAGLHIGIAMDEYAEEHDQGDYLIRGVLGADRERGGLVVGDEVPLGRTVRLQVRDAGAASLDLHQALTQARRAYGPIGGALLFSCNGRGANLFAAAEHDVVAVQEHFAAPVAGFFAAGEIGPVGGRNYLHGFTASLLAFAADG